MRTEELKIYYFDELDDSAKETARDWWRRLESETFETDYLYDDFQTIAKILGIEFDTRQIPLMNGSTRGEPKIWWSGFSSQGDGACFEGYYYYAKGAAKEVRKYAPQDTVLHQIADDLQDVQRSAFYQLSARIDHSDRYYHAGTMRITVERDDGEANESQEDAIIEALRGFADWIYQQLEAEHEYRMSDENVDESIRANEYEFTEDGACY